MIELKVPSVGESITEVQVGEWLVGEGQDAAADQIVVYIETDKVTMELPAPQAGIVTKVLKAQGESATVGEVIGHFEAAVGPASTASESAGSGAGATVSAAAKAAGAGPAGRNRSIWS